jgi:hypothetical protein
MGNQAHNMKQGTDMTACVGIEPSSAGSTAGVTDGDLRHLLLGAALSMSEHPQDHGWREIYRHIASALRNDADPLMTLVNSIPAVDALAPAYVIGLIAISLQQLWQDHELGRDLSHRQLPGGALTKLAIDYRLDLSPILASHRNSFTGVRRFLVPQVLLARHFARSTQQPISCLDIGTGLGILPRQLDSEACFRRFAADLTWPAGPPEFSNIGIEARFGMELSPVPDLAWVRGCYGPSEYYDRLFQEMRETLTMLEMQTTNFTFVNQDARDLPGLAQFIIERNISAVTAVYSLYQYSPDTREAIARVIHRSLPAGGIFIDIEPHPALARPGCLVEARISGVRDKLTVCVVSDGHFRGAVMAAKDFDTFTRYQHW